MSRRPEFLPIVDCLPALSLVDPAPASIRHLQRADLRTHALQSGWGGPGLWVPLRLDSAKGWTGGADPQVCVRVPPGVEHLRCDLLVSGSGIVELRSATTGSAVSVVWEDEGGGDTLSAARYVATAGAVGEDNGPLQVRSGYTWQWDGDEVTVDYQDGAGTVWGLRYTPIHVAR